MNRSASSLALRAACGLLCGGLLINWAVCAAQETPAARAGDAAPPPETLAARQEALALRYQRFENTLLQLAEYLRKTDPDRAELLVRALGRSKENQIPDQFRQLIDLLKKDQLGDAVDSQQDLVAQMQTLLQLLQSEDRRDEIERERQRLRDLIKETDKLISRQTDVRAQTERGGSGEKLQDQQRQVSDSTQKLVEKIEAQDAAKNSQQGGTGGKEAKGPPPAGEKKPGEKKPGEEPQAGEPKPGAEPKPDKDAGTGKSGKAGETGKSGKPGESKPDQKDAGKPATPPKGEPSQSPPKPGQEQGGQSPPSGGKPPKSASPPQGGKGQPSDQPPPEQQPESPEGGQQPSPMGEDQPGGRPRELQQTPGRQELERAREEMERAIEELKAQRTQKASDKQDEALAELLKAKERLEEILRQLREEERELMLAALEARFRDMLARQINVYNGTVGLSTIPEEQRAERQQGRAVELARNQDEIALLAAKVLTLLKEEGSSIAFPEAVEQIRADMLTIARRLERVDVGEITQAIEKDVIESLEEILESLQKELEKSKDRKQQPPQQGQPQQQDSALVDTLSELKMLRSLQYRINRRTKQLGRLVDGEQSADPDVRRQLQQLSARQAKIQRTTYDLATGRNR